MVPRLSVKMKNGNPFVCYVLLVVCVDVALAQFIGPPTVSTERVAGEMRDCRFWCRCGRMRVHGMNADVCCDGLVNLNGTWCCDTQCIGHYMYLSRPKLDQFFDISFDNTCI